MSTLVGWAFLCIWRAAGLLAWPVLWLHPRSRVHLCDLLAPEPGRTWLHGASAGENVAAAALAAGMVPKPWRTHLSMRTQIRGTRPAPLDLPWVVSAWLDRARPSRLVLIEGELWPGWIAACRKRRIPIVVVGSRETRASRRWKWIPGLWTWLSKDILFLAQSEIGDLKGLAPIPPPPFPISRPVFVAASTQPGEESLLLDAWTHLAAPRPLLILAPRRLERVPELNRCLASGPWRWSTRSRNPDPTKLDVLLLDTMGELDGLFPLANAAWIGGTLDPKLGGHSPALAFRSGLPVVAGPHRTSNPEAWKRGRTEGIESDATGARLAEAIRKVLEEGPDAVESVDSLEPILAKLPIPRTPPERVQRPFLWPFVPIWRLLSRSRPSEQGEIPCPVISVGGLTAGGSGKTPAVAWLAESLDDAWVIGRGYRRERRGPPVRIGHPDTPPEHDLGDELEMLRRRGIPVVSAPDRIEGAKRAVAAGARFVLLDDGFRNRRLRRDLDIVCIDRRWPSGRGPIPVGTGRHSRKELDRADWIWMHHDAPPGCTTPTVPDRPRLSSTLEPRGWKIRGRDAPLSAVSGPVDVVVGIARPEGFLCTLLDLGLELRSVTILPDHGRLPPLPSQCVVTEKDAARLPVDADLRVLVADLEIEGGTELLTAIRELEAT